MMMNLLKLSLFQSKELIKLKASCPISNQSGLTTEMIVKRQKVPSHSSLLKITISLELVTCLEIREVKMLKMEDK